MTESARKALESFLVEDVILTLGTLRGALEWLGQEPRQSRIGIERIDHQLGLLEDRARAVCAQLRDEAKSGGKAPVPDQEAENLFAAFPAPERGKKTVPDKPPMTEERFPPVALRRQDAPAHVFFHSRRA